MRDRLIELIASKVCEDYSPSCDEYVPHSCEKCYANSCRIGEIADHLLANGVIVPPCEVGTVVYRVCKQKYPVDSYRMHWEEDWFILTCQFDLSMIPEIGKTVFLTRKEAEQASRGDTTND